MPLFTLQDVPWLPIADAVTKATLLLGIAALLSALLRGRSAATRHLVWTLALLAVLALPALSMSLPRWQLPVLRLASDQVTPAIGSAPSLPLLRRGEAAAPRSIAQPELPVSQQAPAPAASTGITLSQISWGPVLLVLWLAGAAAVLGRLVFGIVAVQWLARRTEPADGAAWFERACRLANEVGVSPGVRFLRSTRATMPMAIGIVRPAIVMPADADTWPAERLRIVLLHELAHVKRRDCLTHALAQIACALYWFNPLVWIAARHVRTERERACDDLVLASGTRGPDYADQLLEIARVMRAGRFPAVLAGASLAMAYRSQLEGRLMAILDPKVPRAGISSLRVAAGTALVVALVLPLASVQPWAYAQDARDVHADVEQTAAAPDAAPGAAERAQGDSPKPNPTPTPAPAPSSASNREMHSAQRVVASTTQGLVQDVIQGATQGAIQGMKEGAVAGAIDEHLINDAAVDAIASASGQSGWKATTPSEWRAGHGRNTNKNETQDEPSGRRRSKADPKTIAALTVALKDSDADVRETALQALVQLRDPAVYEPLLEALRDTSAEVREQAAFGLGELRDRRAVPALAVASKDSVADVREQAVFALGQLRDASAVDALIAAVRDTHADVREQAVFALGQIRDRRAVEALVSALKDAAPDVREQSAFALGQIRDRSAVEALVIALKDTNADVREQVAFALGQLDDARAIDGLTAALKDPSADVRQQAAFALGQLAR